MAKADNSIRALGYFLGEAKQVLGDDLLPKDVELMTAYPKQGLASIHAKMLTLGKLDDEAVERIAGILDLVGECPDGYLHPEKQGQLLLGFHHYDREMVSAKEAADRLGVSVQRVYRMVDEGKLDGYRTGGKMMLFSKIVEARAE